MCQCMHGCCCQTIGILPANINIVWIAALVIPECVKLEMLCVTNLLVSTMLHWQGRHTWQRKEMYI